MFDVSLLAIGCLWKLDPPAEVSFSFIPLKIPQTKSAWSLDMIPGDKGRKRKTNKSRNHRKKFCGKKATCEQIFTFKMCFSRKCFSLPRVNFSLFAILSPFDREISNISPFHNVQSNRIIACNNQDKISI